MSNADKRLKHAPRKRSSRSDKEASQLDHLTLLAKASAILSESLEYEETLRRAARAVVPDFADWCAIDLLDDSGTLRRLAVAHVNADKVELARTVQKKYPPDPDSKHGVMHVIRTGEPEMMSEIPSEVIEAAAQDEEHLRIIRDLDLRSYICVPLTARGRVLGAVTFVTAESGRGYDSTDLELGIELARRASQAIDNARLYSDLRDSEQRFRLMGDAAPVMIWISGVDKLCTWFNKPWLDFVGRPLEQELGNGWSENVHPDDFDRCLQTYETAFDARHAFSMEYRLRRHDGQYRWVLDNGQPLHGEDGLFTGYIGSTVDISERKETEETLRKSEENYRAVVENQAEMLCRFRPDGTILFVNAAYARARGTTPEVLKESNFWEFVAEDDRATVRAMLDSLTPEAPVVRIENRFETKDGVRWTLWTNRALTFDTKGRALDVQSSGIDITERKQAEQALRESEERFRLATRAGRVGVWDWDIVANIVTWSDTIYRIHGLEPGTFGGTVEAFAELVHPEDRGYVNETIQRAMHQDAPYELEFRAVRPDGGIIWIYTRARVMRNASGAPVRMLGGTVDVTQRKQAELALREREERYELVLAGAGAAIWDWDVQAKRVVFSPRWKELRGLSDGEVSDREEEWSSRIHPDDFERVMAAVQAHFQGKTPVFAEEYRVQHKDGHWIWILDRGLARRDSEGQVIRMAGSETDITQRKQTEEALHGQLRRLRTIYHLSSVVARAAKVKEISEAALDGLIEAIHADRSSLLLFDDDGVMRFKGWRGLSESYRQAVEGHTPWTPDDLDAAPIVIADVAADQSLGELRETILSEGIRSLAFVPLIAAARVLGKFMVYFDQPHEFTEEELQLCQTIAGHVAHAIERTQVDQARRESEERLRQLAETIREVFYVTEPQGVMYVSNAYEQIWGRSTQSLYDDPRSFLEAIHPEDRPRIEKAMQRQQKGEVTDEEYRIIRPNGEQRWIHDRAYPLLDETGFLRRVVGDAEDITDRKHAEAALKAKDAELELVAKTTPLILSRCSRDLRYLFVNRSAAELFSLTPDQIIGKPIVDIMGETAFEIIKPYVDQVLRGEAVEYEAQIPYEMVGRRWMHVNYIPDYDEDGQVVGWVASIVDITARKEIEEELRESQERFRDIFQTAGVSVWVEDFTEVKSALDEVCAKGVRDLRAYLAEHPEFVKRCIALVRIVDVNDESLELFRAQNKSDLLVSLADIFTPETEAVFAEELMALAEGRGSLKAEVPLRTLDGRLITVLFAIHFGSEVGDYSRIVVTLTDITLHKQAEIALRESEHALREENQRKDEFVAMLAHELRNPLAAIATSGLILRKNPNTVRRQRSVEVIERQVAHLRRIVDDLLDVTRLRRGKVTLKKEQLEIGEQIRTAIESVNPLIKQKRHHLSVDIRTKPIFVQADPVRLQQVLVNLLHNAATYTDQGGEIWLTVSEENGQVVCHCRDNGRGIEPDKLDYLFEPFTQIDPELHRQDAGLGIGLAMVKQLMALHGGSVKATSAGRGKGCEFSIRLPMVSPLPKEKGVSTRAPKKKLQTKKRQILIVEDNEYFASSLKDFLQEEGHRVWVVDNGKDAISHAHANHPDVILLDIGLPGQDGYAVAQQIKELPDYDKTILIAMSGYDQDKRKSKGLFDSYFVKSSDPESLLEFLQQENV